MPPRSESWSQPGHLWFYISHFLSCPLSALQCPVPLLFLSCSSYTSISFPERFKWQQNDMSHFFVVTHIHRFIYSPQLVGNLRNGLKVDAGKQCFLAFWSAAVGEANPNVGKGVKTHTKSGTAAVASRGVIYQVTSLLQIAGIRLHFLMHSTLLIHSSLCFAAWKAEVCKLPAASQQEGEQRGSRLMDRRLMDSTEQMEQLQSPEVVVHRQTRVSKPRQDL